MLGKREFRCAWVDFDGWQLLDDGQLGDLKTLPSLKRFNG